MPSANKPARVAADTTRRAMGFFPVPSAQEGVSCPTPALSVTSSGGKDGVGGQQLKGGPGVAGAAASR